LKTVVRVEPPGIDAVARSKSAAERGVRARYSSTTAIDPSVRPHSAAIR
jgi:hypothetical protein